MRLRDTEDRQEADLDVRRGQRASVEALSVRAEQAEEELTHFFEESLDLQCVAGFDGYFKRLNSAWTTRLGWTHRELTAKPFLEFVHPDDREATTAEIERLAAAGAATTLFENRYRHSGGSYHWLQWNARPATGHPLIYATARDVTRKKWLERQIIEIADREKERMGRELHDGVCQSLAGVVALSSTLSRSLAARGEWAASSVAAEVAKLLNEIMGEARKLARGLGPFGLNAASLADALETLARNVEYQFHVACVVESDDPLVRLPSEVKLHLFRIAQEAVHNALAHGRAGQIEIGLSCRDEKGVLRILDDGVGIPDGAYNPEGIGLHTMFSRARLIGGSLKLRPRTPRGTAVICSFPLPEMSNTGDHSNYGRNER